MAVNEISEGGKQVNSGWKFSLVPESTLLYGLFEFNRAGVWAAPPMPGMPDTGLPGALDPAPMPAPPRGDPWATMPSTSIYDQYVYTGLTWSTHDLGCMGGLGDVNATLDTTIGNFFLSGGAWIASATNGIHNKVANPNQYMAPLDAVVATVISRLHDAIWSPGGIACPT